MIGWSGSGGGVEADGDADDAVVGSACGVGGGGLGERDVAPRDGADVDGDGAGCAAESTCAKAAEQLNSTAISDKFKACRFMGGKS
jgi:hypothetical protein